MMIQTISNAAGAGAQTPAPAAPAAKARSAPAQQDAVPVAAQAAAAPEPAELRKVADQINAQLRALAQGIRFSVDDDTGRTIVRVLDTETGQVLRQIPSEEMLAISQSLERLQGLLLQQEA
jgi:flagellar protein FlaG